VQGRKHIILGSTEDLCDGSSFLLSSIDVPAQSQIIEASKKTPLLVMFLSLDMPTVREVLSRDDVPGTRTSSHRQGLAVGKTTVGLLGACSRLLDLLDTPEDIPFLSHLNSARNRVPHPTDAAGRAATRHCDEWRSESKNDKSDRLAEGQLCQAFAYGRPGVDRKDGSFNTASSVSRTHRDEPAAVPKTATAPDRA